MQNYLFLCAWVQGSESSEGLPKSRVHSADDLYPQFKKGNDQIFAVLIVGKSSLLSDERIALQFGYAQAFHANFTGHNTVSEIKMVDKNVQKVLDRFGPEYFKTVEVYL